MIGVRGPKDIPVLDRNAAPLKDICESLVLRNDFSIIKSRFNITTEELQFCADAFIENYGPTENDFIEIECSSIEGDLEVITAGVSDWVMITVAMMGSRIDTEEDRVNNAFAIGLRSIMHDCLTEVSQEKDVASLGFIHDLVYNSFCSSYGDVGVDDSINLLATMDIKDF